MSRVLVLDAYARAFINFRRQFVEALVAAGHEVLAAAPDFDAELRSEVALLGASPLDIDLERTGMSPLRDLRSLRDMTRVMRRVAPDVLVSYTPKGVAYGSLAGILAGVPRRCAMITGLGYGFVGSSWRSRVVAAVQRLLYRLVLPSCDVVLFQNPDDLALFRELGVLGNARTGIVNGSGVDLARFEVAPLPATPTFLMVGRLLVGKGVREYLVAAARVRDRHPDARFLLVGWLDETNRDSIGSLELERLLADGHVEYMGQLKDVRPALARSSVFVLPSHREGTPRSVLEAMAMGRAVVTTDAPGCRETVEAGRNGFLVPVASPDALAKAMARYVEDPGLAARHGREGRILAEAKYDVHKVNDSIMRQLGLQPEGAR